MSAQPQTAQQSVIPAQRNVPLIFTLLGLLGLFGLGLLVSMLAQTWFDGGKPAAAPISAAAQTATALCIVPTGERTVPVLMWEIWGTPTQTPTPVGYDISPTPTITATPAQVEAGNVERGRIWFSKDASCSTCHDPERDVAVLGPSLKGIALRAGNKYPNMSAEAYLRGAILDPDGVITPLTKKGVMPILYSRRLSPQQIEDLVAYLMTLK